MWSRSQAAGGGGSDGTAHGKINTSEAGIIQQTEFDINTGLSAITKTFIMWSYPATSRPNGITIDPVNHSGKYAGFGSSTNFDWTNIGTSAGATYYYQVVSVNGGVVRLKSMNNTSYIADTLYWFAE